ncbi:CheY-like chemotaxis protein [Bradyrhizobium japonicum]
MVVEDEPMLLLMANDLVEDAGLHPLLAGNADEAIRIELAPVVWTAPRWI